MQKYSNCFLGVKKGCKSRNCLIYTLYCGERGIRKAKPSRGHISKNNPYLATQPPLRENPLEKAAAGIAAFCCGTERPSCCSDDLLETKKSDRQKFVAAAAFGSRRERDSNPRYSYPYTAFRVRPDRPLRHLSNMFGLLQSIYLSASAFPVHPNPTAARLISRALGLTVCKDKNFYFMLEHVGGLFLILIPKMARILSFAR